MITALISNTTETTEEMAGWHHRLNGHEFEQTPGVGDGQGGLACCGHAVAKTEQLSNNANQSVVMSR